MNAKVERMIVSNAHSIATSTRRSHTKLRTFASDPTDNADILFVRRIEEFAWINTEVAGQADVILEQTVAGHLRIPTRPVPGLGGLDEPASPASPSQVGVDVPALDVPDGRCVAAVRMVPGSRFEEPAQQAVSPIDDEDRLRRLV